MVAGFWNGLIWTTCTYACCVSGTLRLATRIDLISCGFYIHNCAVFCVSGSGGGGDDDGVVIYISLARGWLDMTEYSAVHNHQDALSPSRRMGGDGGGWRMGNGEWGMENGEWGW